LLAKVPDTQLIAPKLIEVAQILRPHGVRGCLKIKSHTSPPDQLLDYNPLLNADGSVVELQPFGWQAGDLLLAFCAGITDRTAAEALNGQWIYVTRDQLAAADDPDDYYLADLIGLQVFDAASTSQPELVLGTVQAVENYGAGDLLTIGWTDAARTDPRLKTLLEMPVPFSKAWVERVDVPAGRLYLNLPSS
jgi:16S rRNA processing protein RimM